MNADTVLQRADSATFQVIDNEAVVIDMNSGTYFSLNKVGTQFWEMLDGRHSIGDHAETIAEQYDVDSQMVTADLLELAQQLNRENLVEARDA